MLKRIIGFCIDLIFPPDPLVVDIEAMTPLSFSHAVEKNTNPLIPALFSYKDPLVQTAIWELKYKNNKKITTLLACLLNDFILSDLEEKRIFELKETILIVPIPLSKERFKERGYNQCEVLIDAMPQGFAVKSTLLKKVRHTETQTKLDKERRKENLKNCFEITEDIKGKYIILIDDVYTTGATLEEAKSTLLNAGATHIFYYTIAH